MIFNRRGLAYSIEARNNAFVRRIVSVKNTVRSHAVHVAHTIVYDNYVHIILSTYAKRAENGVDQIYREYYANGNNPVSFTFTRPSDIAPRPRHH